MTLARTLSGLALAGGLASVAPQAQAAADITVATSPGGIEYWLVEERTIPMVALEIAFDGGASADPEGAAGAANYLSAMLDEGAGDLDSVAFSARAQLLAADFGFSASRDAITVSARMLEQNLDDSVALLRDAINAPRFDAEPLARVKAQILSSIRSDESDPDALASNAWFAAAFPGDPYGRPTKGQIETVAAMTADDLREGHRRLLTRSGAKIGVVGAIDVETAGRVIDTLLGDLPAEAPAEGPMVEVTGEPGVAVVPFNAPQSNVIFGHDGPLRDDPDFIPAFVMNHILGGGGFSSRLTTEVREKRGLAYSTYAYLATLDRTGLYMGGVGTANERVGESLDVIRAEWRRMADEGVTEQELEDAKRYLTGAYALRFDSNAKIAGILVGLQRDGLGPEYVEERNALVEAVTREDVARVAREWLKPESLRFVVVGQPEGLPVTQ